MGGFSRYAVYFAPRPEQALGRWGADWLGWDAEAGVERPGLVLDGLPAPREAIVAAPARYGFHGTLKAPFRLADGAAFGEFDLAVAGLAAGFEAFGVPLRLARMGPFLALIPAGDSAALRKVADACVTRLDAFRAPPAATEVARRRAGGLTPRQDASLAAWGYPYVLDDFGFHLTLTGPLEPHAQAATEASLRRALGAILETPMAFEDLCVFGEAADGRFHLVTRHALGGAAGRP